MNIIDDILAKNNILNPNKSTSPVDFYSYS
jgi:hypothetical protein